MKRDATVCFRLPAAEKAALDREASKSGATISELIQRAVANHIAYRPLILDARAAEARGVKRSALRVTA